MRRLKVIGHEEVEGRGSTLWGWPKYVSPWRAARNIFVLGLCKSLPLRAKNFLYRALGMRIGDRVAIGLGAMFDIFYPQLVEIGDDTIIGYNATILCHDVLVDSWRAGRVRIGKRVLIGANCTILPGVTIGDGAVVSAMSLVNKDIPAGAFVGGVPAKELRKDYGGYHGRDEIKSSGEGES